MFFSKRKNAPMLASPILAEHERLLEQKCCDTLKELLKETAKLGKDWESRLRAQTDLMIGLCKGREALRSVYGKSLQSAPTVEILRFQTSSLFLRDSCQFLTSDPRKAERLHLVTGTEAQGIKVLSRMEHVKLEEQSAVYVKANDQDSHLKIVELTERYGHALLAIFHSHISKGADSTTPSGTDIQNQDRLAKLQCEAIGGIFSLDGYVRFFSTWKPFEMEVFGKNVRKVHDEPMEKVFQLLP